MAESVIIADAEFAFLAQDIYSKAQEMKFYANYAAECFAQLGVEGISSDILVSVFNQCREELNSVAEDAATCVANLGATVTGFVEEIDSIDTFIY